MAEKLGVSARHLRRLFNEHLGVTPNALARSTRAHFARRRLDDPIASAASVGALMRISKLLWLQESTPGKLPGRIGERVRVGWHPKDMTSPFGGSETRPGDDDEPSGGGGEEDRSPGDCRG